MTDDELEAAVAAIPGPTSWWHHHNGETYLQLAQRLVSLGLTREEALDTLTDAYHAAANEYGNG
jgi:hypothetical protein